MIKYFSKQYIASFYLVLMCVQILALEGFGVSNIKVAAMALAPLIILYKAPYLSKATLWLSLYFSAIVFSLSQVDTFRSSTIIYMVLFLIMFNMYYNLIIGGAFSLNYFIQLLRFIILAYTICLILQQLMMIVGIRYFPPLNLLGQGYLSLFRLNSLSWEPSSSARILLVCFLALLKTTEIKHGNRLSLAQLYKLHKWIIIGFLYSMLTIGSGTAIVGLAILSLYFIRKKYLVYIIPLLICLFIILPQIDYVPLNRAMISLEATLSGQAENIIEADQSAAVRIVPLINTFKNLDISSKKTWFGEGTDASLKEGLFGSERMIGGINDYGLLSYIILLLFIYACCIKKVFSIETLILIFLMGGGVSNISYGWGMLMIFTTSKYFEERKKYFIYKPKYVIYEKRLH